MMKEMQAIQFILHLDSGQEVYGWHLYGFSRNFGKEARVYNSCEASVVCVIEMVGTYVFRSSECI